MLSGNLHERHYFITLGTTMIELTANEKLIGKKILKLKEEAGSHSPSMFTILEKIPNLELKVDACFLSNPYATDLFLTYVKKELIDTGKMRDILEFYPSQNSVIAEILSQHLSVPGKNIFIGNGAVEIIQAVIHNFTKTKILINIPTFSSYYEYVRDGVEIVFNHLAKDNNYCLEVDQYLETVHEHNPDTVVIINPNNPNGGYIPTSQMEKLLDGLQNVDNVLIDESFIHFAYESKKYELQSSVNLIENHNNIIVIKSMSKDFGVAGIRAGYAIMDSQKVESFLKNGYLWNSNGLAEYFFRLYVREDFLQEYEKERIRYIKDTQEFFNRLKQIENIKVYPSMANFALVELLEQKSTDFMSKMLIRYGIYVRTCYDKIGLQGEFVRIASRKQEENEYILQAIAAIVT